MEDVKCEACRDLQEDYLAAKQIAKLFGDKENDCEWTVTISDGRPNSHEYIFKDARGDTSIHNIATLIKLFIDAKSFSHRCLNK